VVLVLMDAMPISSGKRSLHNGGMIG